MDSLEYLKMSLLHFNFVMIYIIYKMLILLQNNLNYLKDSILEYFFKDKNIILFFTTYNNRKFKSLAKKITKLHCS